MIQFRLIYSNPAIIGWYRDKEKQWTHQYAYRTGILFRRMGVFYKRNDYNSLEDAAHYDHLPTVFTMQSNAPVSVTNGAFGIDMEFIANLANYNADNKHPFYIGGNFVRSFIAELSVGNKSWNGTNWVTNHGVFKLYTAGSEQAIYDPDTDQPDNGPGKTYSTRDIDTQPEEQSGWYIPVPANVHLMGKLTFKLYVYDDFDPTALITKCDVKFYPTEPEKENQDAYTYRRALDNGKLPTKEINLDICTKAAPKPGNNLLYTKTGDYAKNIDFWMGDHGHSVRRIEDMLADRMVDIYSTPQETIRVTIKDDGTKWYYNELVTFNNTTWVLLAKKHKYIDNEITLTLQKLL